MTSFDDIRDQARNGPVIAPLPDLAEFYLDDLEVYDSIDGFHADLYDPDVQFEQDVLINADVQHSAYPRLDCSESALSPCLNTAIDWASDDDHDRLMETLLGQSGIKDYVLDSTSTEEVIVLVIVDGLSFDRMRDAGLAVRPALVDGISITELGYRRVIYGSESGDSMSIYGSLLNGKGFYDTFGFTYWERGQEALSTDLHAAMDGDDVHRIKDFTEAVRILEREAPIDQRTYVQITRMGLDQDSHNRKERPDRDHVRDTIIDDLRMLHEALSGITSRFRIMLTADHGILWEDQLPDDPPIVADEYHHHARYIESEGSSPGAAGAASNSVTGGRMVWDPASGEPARIGLAYPYLTRTLDHTEWGVHGGFSYFESLVPFVELTEADTI
jgi:hypothetical protein